MMIFSPHPYPQVIHITPLAGHGQQQYILQNPGEPPIQLLLQQPGPVVTTTSATAPVLHKPLVQIPIAGTPVRPSPASKVWLIVFVHAHFGILAHMDQNSVTCCVACPSVSLLEVCIYCTSFITE